MAFLAESAEYPRVFVYFLSNASISMSSTILLVPLFLFAATRALKTVRSTALVANVQSLGYFVSALSDGLCGRRAFHKPTTHLVHEDVVGYVARRTRFLHRLLLFRLQLASDLLSLRLQRLAILLQLFDLFIKLIHGWQFNGNCDCRAGSTCST